VFWLTFFVNDTKIALLCSMFTYTLLSSLLWFQLFCSLFTHWCPSMLAIYYAPSLTPIRLLCEHKPWPWSCASTAKSAGQSTILFALIVSCCLTSSLPISLFFWDGLASDRRCASVVQIFCSAVLGESRLHLYHGFNYQLQYVQLCFL
jgi:hypothetical protein